MRDLEVIPLLQSLNKGDPKIYGISIRTMEILEISTEKYKLNRLTTCSKKKLLAAL